ncbi:glycosyltransferase family 4 protein [Candidatus Beckwithbacteria bacterium]|nr:glycosyltransferase family 4 protein [Candidatus Beckwithbacteria bacterium]
MKKKKIAIFHNLPGGGAKRVFNKLNLYLSKDFKIKEFTIKSTPNSNFFSYLFFTIATIPKIHRKIASTINNADFNFVIIHHDLYTKSPYILRCLKLKTIYICHEEPREFYSDKRYFSTSLKLKLVNLLRHPLKFIDLLNVKYATIAVANSKFSQKKLSEIYKRNFEIIRLGVDVNKFKPNKKQRKKYYLTIGAMSKFKGIDFLIDSLSKLPKEKQYPLVVVGDKGRDYKNLVNQAKVKNIKIILKNKISENELIKTYQESQLTLAAGINEPFGLFLLESISCGTPIVAVNEGGYSEIIQNPNLGILSPRNVHKFSENIIKQLDKRVDKKKMYQFVQDNWTWKQSYNDLKQIVKKL